MQPACPAPTLLISSFFASHECAVHQYYILSPQSFSLLPSIFFFQPRYRMLSFYQHIMVLLITRRGPGREAAQRESWMQKQSREGVMEALCTEMTNQLYIIKKTNKEGKEKTADIEWKAGKSKMLLHFYHARLLDTFSTTVPLLSWRVTLMSVLLRHGDYIQDKGIFFSDVKG